MKRLLVGQCVYAVATGSRCGAKALAGRSLCAEHITTACDCGRQVVRECREFVGRKVCGRPTCTRCKCPVHSRIGQEPKLVIHG